MLATRFTRAAQNRAILADRPLSEDEIMRVAPSVFAESAHESRSSRYTYIPTISVLRGLQENGFRPFFATQAISRTESNRSFTKHMLRFRHENQIARQRDDVNEVILINSHNGASSYQMLAGCFRFVCANGMVCGTTQFDVRVKHAGDVRDAVINGAFSILDGFGAIEDQKESMKTLQLTSDEQTVFANASLALRFGVDKLPPIRAEQVIEARRYEDRDNSLWATFQRAQENLTQGGLRAVQQPGARRRADTRPVAGIDGNVALNRGLWVLAEGMKELKS